jgi:hypothetical protein
VADVRHALLMVGLCVGCGGGELIFETHSDAEGPGAATRMELTLEGGDVRLRERRSGDDRRASGELTAGGVDALTAARAGVTRTLAEAVPLCGTADTTRLVYHLEDNEGPFFFSHCRDVALDPTVALLVDVIDDILLALRRCDDNAVITIKGACIAAI